MAALKDPSPLTGLLNGDFEGTASEGDLGGWTATAGSGSTATLDTTQKRSGASSLKLVSTGQSVSVVSAPIDAPKTGRIAVDLWLKGGTAGLPAVRIALEGNPTDGKFDPFGITPAAPANPMGGWVRFSFPVDDVPSEGLSEVRVRLDLTGPGEVWVEDVQVFDLPFTESERWELSKLISLASVKLEAGQLADCARLLESYWPQFLMANVPLAQSPAPVAVRPQTETPAEPAKKSGILESLKEYLPRKPAR